MNYSNIAPQTKKSHELNATRVSNCNICHALDEYHTYLHTYAWTKKKQKQSRFLTKRECALGKHLLNIDTKYWDFNSLWASILDFGFSFGQLGSVEFFSTSSPISTPTPRHLRGACPSYPDGWRWHQLTPIGVDWGRLLPGTHLVHFQILNILLVDTSLTVSSVSSHQVTVHRCDPNLNFGRGRE